MTPDSEKSLAGFLVAQDLYPYFCIGKLYDTVPFNYQDNIIFLVHYYGESIIAFICIFLQSNYCYDGCQHLHVCLFIL